jgi:adenosylcobinamide kinase/adenosylcobinamide-phosphate guanylyltransferase
MALPAVSLILGGARSGKSAYAEGLITSQPGAWVYLATAEAGDAEMRARIDHHRARRGPGWLTVEEPLELAATLLREVSQQRAVLVDCLTLWLANLMAAGRDLEVETEKLLTLLAAPSGPVVLVSNEVGLGIVPETALGRRFRDHAGRLNQQVAAQAQSVVFMAAGLPLQLKTPDN